MRLRSPRIPPLNNEEFTPEQAALLKPYDGENGIPNIFLTVARSPRAAQGFLGWGRYVLRESSSDARLREIVILRIGWLCRSGYEWTQHAQLGLRVGLTRDEIERIKLGPSDAEWSPVEALLLGAADELHSDKFVSDATWAALKAHFSEAELMDVVYVAAHYTQVSMILNTFGIQVEDHQVLDEALRA